MCLSFPFPLYKSKRVGWKDYGSVITHTAILGRLFASTYLGFTIYETISKISPNQKNP